MADSTQNQKSNVEDTGERLRQRALELRDKGVGLGKAWEISWLEERIRQWPKGYGDDLQVVIYGDFEPPKHEITFETLGITVLPGNIRTDQSFFRNATAAVRANVKVGAKDVPSVIDATRRINVLLGSLAVTSWGNTVCGWWSWVTHGTAARGMGAIEHEDLEKLIKRVLGLRMPVRRKIESAFYWIREPHRLLMESYRSDLLQVYAGCWNVFECLVDAVTLLHPRKKLTTSQKKKLIDDFVQQKKRSLEPRDIEEMYQNIVRPGFVGKARHVLRVCFPKEWKRYERECFKAGDDSLYHVRNAINHGDIDAENPEELIRIGEKLARLQIIVLMMFGRLLPFAAPADVKQSKG